MKDDQAGKTTGGRNLSEPELAGASLPEGIEVDETSAYFGITQSSDIVHQLMSMERNQSITAFFNLVSDVVLKPGEFDFEEASKVLNCEGGEIYYLVSGHLGLMNFSDPLLHYLGLPNSLGEESPSAKPAITDSQYAALKRLSDPMNILKILAIAQNTGGSEELMKYYLSMTKILHNAAENSSLLIDIANEFDAALDVIGHPIPISNLANSTVDIGALTTAKAVPKPTSLTVELPVEKPHEDKVELPRVVIDDETIETVPLPNQPAVVELPVKPTEEFSVESTITDRKAAKVTDNAFEGAFGMMAPPAEEPTLVEKTANPAAITNEEFSVDAAVNNKQHEQLTASDELADQEPFVSAAEMFIEADSDGDGTLSVEELSAATGLSTAETEELHKSADKDDDGKMSLSEFVASPAAEKVASSQPRLIAPVRKPVSKPESRPNLQQGIPQQPAFQNQSIPPRPLQQANVQPEPITRAPAMTPPPQYVQQPVRNQTVQPTIRSGVNCQACGIGIDPFWRFCPVCGSQNLN